MSKVNNIFRGRLLKYFTQRLGAYKYRNGWYKTLACPYCGKPGKFGINISLNRGHCFRCEVSPSLIDLVQYLEKVDTYAEVIAILNKSEYDNYAYVEETPQPIKVKKTICMPDGFMLLNQGNSNLANIARAYVKKRGFDVEELSKAGWGYGTKGKYFGYLIIPFHENGELIYYNARLFIGNGPRYNNPEVGESGIGKSFIIYNRDALFMYNSVFLCEGAINAQTMGPRGIASGGKSISRYQINLIIKSPVKRVIILYDSDAKLQAINLAMQLVNYKKVKVVFMPEDKDCNDLGRKETLRIVYSTRYQNYNELLSLKQQIK